MSIYLKWNAFRDYNLLLNIFNHIFNKSSFKKQTVLITMHICRQPRNQIPTAASNVVILTVFSVLACRHSEWLVTYAV